MTEIDEEKMEDVTGGSNTLESQYMDCFECPKCGTVPKIKVDANGVRGICKVCGSTVTRVRKLRSFK